MLSNLVGDLTGLVLLCALVAVLIFGFVMDAYAVFLRVAGIEGLAEVLAMSNLVQYLARISNVLVIFILSVAFETGRLRIPVSSIFFLASLVGVVTVFGLIKSPRLCDLVRKVLVPVLYPSFRGVARISVWRDTGHFNKSSFKLAVYSSLTNTLIVFAMYVPFGLAAVYPEMRMSSVYFGQLMNFFATLLVFGIQDPISMRLIDSGNLKEAGTSLLYGRVFSYLMTSLIFFTLLVSI